MDRFSKYNPKTILLFFASVIVTTMILFNPIYLAISLVGAFLYKIVLDGRNALMYLIKFIVPILLLIMLFNFLFVHKGETALFVLFDMRFTLESLAYGFTQGLMFGAVMMWFSCYNSVITPEGFMSVFGETAPDIILVFSMVLTFIPRLKKNLAQINDARYLIDEGSDKLTKAVNNFSALITMTLEESIETADSMKARGYNNKRKPYNRYHYSFKDFLTFAFCFGVVVFIIVLKIQGKNIFIYDPKVYMAQTSAICVCLYSVMSLLPVIIDAVEDIKWLYLKQKI